MEIEIENNNNNNSFTEPKRLNEKYDNYVKHL